MSQGKDQKGISRRDFLKGAAVGAGAAALSGMALERGEATVAPVKWDRAADVVVIGYGAAGVASAIVAHDAGAKVLILEKTEAGGGSTYMSGGYFVSPSDPGGAVDYLLACGKAGDGMSFDLDPGMLRAWAEEAVKNADWVKSLGGEVSILIPAGWYAEFKGADTYKSWGPTKVPFGVGLWKILSQGVTARGIEIAYQTSAKELALNDKNEVVGLVAETAEKRIAVKAKRAVVLTCGSFDYDETMKKNYLKAYPKYSVGYLGNTGDAIKLAARAGAALWHMNEISGTLCHKFPEVPVAYVSMLQLTAAKRAVILVNRRGERFVNETLSYDAVEKALDYFDPIRRDFPNIPCWCIFDEKARVKGPAGLPVPFINPVYKWSGDNSEEIARGWIIKADTLSELADRIGLDASKLEHTLRVYNECAQAGKDPDFGRQKLIPLEGPPYYALKGYPGIFSTYGGPRINEKAQVLDAQRRRVPRLYAAGSASAFPVAFLYPLSGTMIGDAFAMGRIAGRNAAAETSWQ